jgi:hypothetical protein
MEFEAWRTMRGVETEPPQNWLRFPGQTLLQVPFAAEVLVLESRVLAQKQRL